MRLWIRGARPRTLPAAVVPVAVGTAAAVGEGVIVWRAVAALIVSLALQVGVNYANDYSDGVRGTDDARRVGPVRLVGQGLAAPAAVKRAAQISFAIAGVVGSTLAIATAWWLVLVGGACIAAGWYYTGGSRPYGYAGLGELFVFVFFGLVATVGSTFVQTETVTGLAVAASVPVGLLATALLVVNNLRDIPGDTEAGKQTLAVRLGDPRTRELYTALVVVSFLTLALIATWRPHALVALAAVAMAIVPVRIVRSGAKGPLLIAALGTTARLHLVFGALLTIGLALEPPGGF